jgi:hypothetical protein
MSPAPRRTGAPPWWPCHDQLAALVHPADASTFGHRKTGPPRSIRPSSVTARSAAGRSKLAARRTPTVVSFDPPDWSKQRSIRLTPAVVSHRHPLCRCCCRGGRSPADRWRRRSDHDDCSPGQSGRGRAVRCRHFSGWRRHLPAGGRHSASAWTLLPFWRNGRSFPSDCDCKPRSDFWQNYRSPMT